MKKLTIPTLLAVFAIITICNGLGQTKTQEPVRGTTTVKVYLSGLMVFHKEEHRDSYEVGILKDAHHKFEIRVGPIPLSLPDVASWTLYVKSGTPLPTSAHNEGHDNKRRPDHLKGQWDFSWLIDLESEFHPTSNFELIPGKLKPIIHLPGGRFHTKYKSMDLMRWQGTDKKDEKNATHFGFVPETIVLELELSGDQELVLRDDATGTERQLVKHTSGPSKGEEVSINNHPHTLNEVSDFYLYYKLFRNPPREDRQYKFKANKDPATRLHPYNPFPGYEKKTCCGMVCTAVLLGERVKALE